MAVKSGVIRNISKKSRSIGAIFGCAAVVARNIIVILVVIFATILFVIIRYDISSADVLIIVIGHMIVDIMFMLMKLVVEDYRPCCMAYLGR